MRTTVRLSVRSSDANVCNQLASVLAPDNEGTPRGMSLEMEVRKETLEIKIASDSSSGAVSTAMAVLRDVFLFQEVWLLSRAKDTKSMGGTQIA
jgi:hypothetical protein